MAAYRKVLTPYRPGMMADRGKFRRLVRRVIASFDQEREADTAAQIRALRDEIARRAAVETNGPAGVTQGLPIRTLPSQGEP